MKKWILILAVGITATSCQWWHETFDDPEECTEWYLNELNEADDIEEFEEIYNDFTIWRSDLGQVDKWKATAKRDEWYDENEKKAEKIEKNIDKLRAMYCE